MGSYRLLLAIVVVISHFGPDTWPFGLMPGVIAVVSFFLISGYVTTSLIEKHYPYLAHLPKFLLDRSMRLFPQYWIYLVISCGLIPWSANFFARRLQVTTTTVALNALMLPSNFYMFSHHAEPLNPPTWTLGLELTFYVVLPFLMVWRWRSAAFACSFCIFLLAFAGIINTDWYGYRLLPGTLFIFLCGSFMRPSATFMQKGLLVGAWLMAVVMLACTTLSPRFNAPHNREVVIGMLIGIPMVALLTKMRYRKIDEIFGNISYGVYLNHFPLIWSLGLFDIQTGSATTWFTRIGLIALSLLLSWISYSLIEKPIVRQRHRIRNREPSFVPRPPAYGGLKQ